jgi:hypothetical protein
LTCEMGQKEWSEVKKSEVLERANDVLKGKRLNRI